MIARVGAADPGLFVLKGALRAAIVMPLAFALSLVVIDDGQMALFAAFGSMALLVFVDFGGTPLARLRAYLLLTAAGAVLIALGTLCSQSTALATVAMALVAFAILFAGVLEDYVAAAHAAAMLTFVLPVMVSADAGAIPMRLAGWGLSAALSIPATLLLWPGRPRSVIRRGAADAARSLAELVEARARGEDRAAAVAIRSARAATVSARERFIGMAQRPSGTTGPTAALARLIEDLGWLIRIADRAPATNGADDPRAGGRADVEAAVAGTLRAVAARLAAAATDAPIDLERLKRANAAFGRAQLARFEHLSTRGEEAVATAELDNAYRVRQLAEGTLQAAGDASQACHGGGAHATRTARIEAMRRLLRAHASLGSVWLRNSLRGAAGLALAVLVGKLTDLQHGFWVVLGAMSVLRSTALATSATIAQALLGTLAGILVGGLIVIAVGADRGALWAVLPVAVFLAAYAPQAISFGAGQAAFTLVVLVLFNLIEPAGWKVGLVRVEDVAAGAAVSLIVGAMLWPRGATAILRGAIGAAYLAAARSLDATIAMLIGDGPAALCEQRAREAFDTAQQLDTALRDYLANRGAAPGRLHDLTLLSTGAGRVRRVAALMRGEHPLWPLTPIGDELPRLAGAREGFDAERRACCGWYEALGGAISAAQAPPEPGRAQTAGDSSRPVVLEAPPGGTRIQPGVAIAWAQRHLDLLAEFEPVLSDATRRINDGAARAARR